MKEIKTSEIQGYLVGQVIVGIIGSLLLLFDDFAGYYYYDYYNRMQEWGYIYLGSGFFSGVLIILMVIVILSVVYSAYKIMREKSVSENLLKAHSKKSIMRGIFVVAVAFIGGAVFAISNIVDGSEWWFDAGFYASMVSGLLFLFFGKQMLNKIKNKY